MQRASHDYLIVSKVLIENKSSTFHVALLLVREVTGLSNYMTFTMIPLRILNNLCHNLLKVTKQVQFESLRNSSKVNVYGMNFDRRIKVDYKDSINYMNSEAYKKTYQGHLIWKLYRRQQKGALPNKKTRSNCINEEGFISTSYPCPVCRDEYLVLHHENTKLLQQFINDHTGEIRLPKETGICQRQNQELIIAVLRARDQGYLTYKVPDRYYDYDEYKKSINE